MNAAEGLRGAGFDGEVKLVGTERCLPYDQPPLSKKALLEGPGSGKEPHRPATWYDDHSVALRQGL